MTVKQYTKKPVEISAIKLTSKNIYDVVMFIEGGHPDIKGDVASDKWLQYKDSVTQEGLHLKTLESNGETQVADVGDYIIKGVKGEFYPCKPDIFKLTYDEI